MQAGADAMAVQAKKRRESLDGMDVEFRMTARKNFEEETPEAKRKTHHFARFPAPHVEHGLERKLSHKEGRKGGGRRMQGKPMKRRPPYRGIEGLDVPMCLNWKKKMQLVAGVFCFCARTHLE